MLLGVEEGEFPFPDMMTVRETLSIDMMSYNLLYIAH